MHEAGETKFMKTFFGDQFTDNAELTCDNFNSFFMAANSQGKESNEFVQIKNKFDYAKDWKQSNRLQTLWDQVRVFYSAFITEG